MELPDNPPEEDLKAAQAGCDDAFARIVQIYEVAMIQLCLNARLSWQDAEDVVQDACLKIYRNIHSFDASRAPFKAWFGVIVKREMKSRYRRNTRQKRDERRNIPLHWAMEDPTEPCADCEAQEIAEFLRSRLPEEHRILLELEITGYDTKDCAKLLGVSVRVYRYRRDAFRDRARTLLRTAR